MIEKIALKKGLISRDVFQKAVAACKNAENYEAALKEYFISNQLISAKEIERLVSTSSAVKILKRNISFGKLALKLGYLSEEHISEALEEQKAAASKRQPPQLIGQILFQRGLLSKEQVVRIVSEQKKIMEKGEAPPKESDPKSVPADEKAGEQSKVINIDGGMTLEISADRLDAFLTKTEAFNDSLTAEDIRSILFSQGIQFGIVGDEMLEGFVRSGGFRTRPFKAVCGQRQTEGRDARLEYFFDTDYLKAGGMDEEGNIDFRDRGGIPKVEKGTLLVKKIALKASRNGRDIYGQEIEAAPVKDVEIKTETGTVFSDDGSRLYSSVSGFPELTWSGYVNVIEEFRVEGDVSYETGHVTYEGNIHVSGRLKSGFCITGNNVTIHEVDGGRIIAYGDVIVLNGVNNADIQARGHVSANFIHASNISCLGHLNVEKEIVDSSIDTSGACRIAKGEVINSKITANKGIQVKNLGTEKTNPNRIKLGQGLYIKKEIARIEKRIGDIQKEKNKLEKRREQLEIENENILGTAADVLAELERKRYRAGLLNRMLAGKPGDNGRGDAEALKDKISQNLLVLDKLDRELNDSFDAMGSNETGLIKIAEQLETLSEELRDLEQEMVNFIEWGEANAGVAVATVEGKVFPETQISGPHTKKILKEVLSRVTLKEVQVKTDNSDYAAYEIQCDDNFK